MSTGPEITLELHPPSRGSGHGIQDWLEEARELRGRVFCENGRRPHFCGVDARFHDPDASDPRCFHIIARRGSKLAGCVRLAPLQEVHYGVVSSAIGDGHLDAVLDHFGTNRQRACEASRWVVSPEFRGELGPRLAAAAWALARWLSMDIALVMAATWQKQDLALIRMGARPVRGVPLSCSETFRGELRLLCFDVACPPCFMRPRIERAATDLGLGTHQRSWQHLAGAATQRTDSQFRRVSFQSTVKS